MTLREVIDTIKTEKHTTLSEAKLIEFVNEVEADVAKQLNVPAPVYKHDHDEEWDKELLVPAPYDGLYISYVKARVDFTNEEYESYQLNVEQHQSDFAEFDSFVVREGVAVKPSYWTNKLTGTF